MEFTKLQNTTQLINAILIVIFIILVSTLFHSVPEFLIFFYYFFILLVAGAGIIVWFKPMRSNGTFFLLTSIVVGFITNAIIFLITTALGIQSITLFILAIGGIASCVAKKHDIKLVSHKLHPLKDPCLPILLMIMLASLFLISDQVYNVEGGIVQRDSLHNIYELNIAQGLTELPAKDLSYAGKSMKYHFGYPIALYQLVNHFQIEPLRLVHVYMPAILLLFCILAIYEFSKFSSSLGKRFLFMLLVIFASLSIPSQLYSIVSKFTSLKLIHFYTAPVLMYFVNWMGSYGFAILITLCLFHILSKDKRNPIVESILITGLALTKAPFFVPVALTYLGLALFQFIRSHNPIKFLQTVTITIPGFLYIGLFILGAHAQTLWVLFPGTFNVRSQTLSSSLLIPNALLSLILALGLMIGLGFVYLVPELKHHWRALRKKELDFNSNHLTILTIIVASSLLGILISDASEQNNIQFFIPGYIMLLILTYQKIIKQFFNKKTLTLLVSLLVINAFLFMVPVFGFHALLLQQTNPGENNNILAQAKNAVIPSGPQLLTKPCIISDNLINGLQFLRLQPEGVLVFNRLHESCEQRSQEYWDPSSGLVRTAVSGKQAVIENHRFKSVPLEPDYCDRTYSNIEFFTLITGADHTWETTQAQFQNTKLPYFQDLAYYNYLSLFSSRNRYTANEEFLNCINTKLAEPLHADRVQMLRDYIRENNISYILFERNTAPLQEFIESLGLEMIFHQGSVRIFITPNHQGYGQ